MAMIETHNLTRTFGEVTALDNLCLQVEDGSCHGFIGPNGAGKTTTIRILATLLKPTWGEARVNGLTVGWQNPLIRPLIGYVPDFIGTYDDMLVIEYLQFFAACYGIHGAKRKRVVGTAIDLTDLSESANTPMASLSRGMSQRLSIARVLLHDPKVLLMDEPAAGLDPRARIEVRSLLSELKNLGKTILISSHILSELGELCDTVSILEQGKLCFSGSMQDALAEAHSGEAWEIEVADRQDEAEVLLKNLQGVAQIRRQTREGRTFLIIHLDPSHRLDPAEIPARLITAGFRLCEFRRGTVDLETAFMHHTRGIVS